MTNAEVIEALWRGAGAYPRSSLDAQACLRAAAWLRWMDAFGATVNPAKAETLRATSRRGEIARSIMADLVNTGLPTPPEDITLDYLSGEEGGGGHVPAFADTSRGPRP